MRYEDNLHAAVCTYVRLQYPGVVLHHSPNEGKRTVYEQARIKRLGVSSGFPDLLIVCPHRKRTLALELKAAVPGKRKGRATDNQLRWIDTLNKAGIPAAVCTGFDEAKTFIDNQLNHGQ